MSQLATSAAIFVIVLVAGAELFPVVGVGLGLMGLDGVVGFFATSAVVGALTGMLGQGLSNEASGRPWDQNLGQAAGYGALAGLAGGLAAGIGSAVLDSMSGEAGAFAADAADGGACGVCCGGGLSFAPSTLVATPTGERAIGSLAVGDTVLAYNPATGKREPEPIQHIWRNNDHDLVDVQLTTTSTINTTGDNATTATGTDTSAQQATATTSTASSRLHRWVRLGVLAAGLAATLLTTTSGGVTTQAHAATASTSVGAPTSETIHSTANHPWLTADRGWVHAGDLRPGEQVVTLPDATGSPASTATTTATVAWVRGVPGAGEMDNLTVARDHTYAVGTTRAVVHNTGGECPYPILYRNLRPDEDPAQGIFATAPDRTDITPAGAIRNGSKPNFKGSPYIPTTRSLDVAEAYHVTDQTRLIAIDTAKVPGEFLDFSTPEAAEAGGMKRGPGMYYALASKEVLIKGYIPPEAILWVKEP